MKKIKFEGKLSLNKQTVAKLDKNQMGNVQGGANGNDNQVQFTSIINCHTNQRSHGNVCCGWSKVQ